MAQQQTAKEQLMLSIPGMFPDKSVDWKARAVGAIRSFGEDECRALLNLQPEDVKLAAIAWASLDGKAGNRTACTMLHVVTAFVLLWVHAAALHEVMNVGGCGDGGEGDPRASFRW